jgi:hypothetical protein
LALTHRHTKIRVGASSTIACGTKRALSRVIRAVVLADAHAAGVVAHHPAADQRVTAVEAR